MRATRALPPAGLLLLQACLLVGCCLAAAGCSGDASKDTLDIRKLVTLKRLSSVAPHPLKSHSVAFVQKQWSGKANQWSYGISAVNLDCGADNQRDFVRSQIQVQPLGPLRNSSISDLTWNRRGDTLFFLAADENKVTQLFSMSVCDGQNVRQVSSFPVDISNLRISPQESFVSFTADVYPRFTSQPLQQTAEYDKQQEQDDSSGMVFTDLFVRHWDQWDSHKRSHIFIVGLNRDPAGKYSLSGEPVDVMAGIDAHSPVPPDGGAEHYDWSPDDTRLAYTTQLGGSDRAWKTKWDIYMVDVKDTRPSQQQLQDLRDGIASPRHEPAAKVSQPTCITCDNPARDQSPSFSPDGQHVAYISMSRPGFEADRNRLVVYSVPTGQRVVLTQEWDRSVDAPLVWSSASSLLFTASDAARSKIFHYEDVTKPLPAGQSPASVIDEHANGNLFLVGDLLYFTQSSLTGPDDVYAVRIGSPDSYTSRLRRLTGLNSDLMQQLQLSVPEEFYYNSEGERVHSWLLKPAKFEAGRKYPVALLIHGGPQGAWGDAWSFRWNPQMFAAAGFVVVAPNIHGSEGWGQAFVDAVSQDWGGKPFRDLMALIDHMSSSAELSAFADVDNMVALGASYGGFMINWLNGHSTHRFKALVCHDGLFDQRAMYYETEELWFPEWEMGPGPQYDRPELYERWSPVAAVNDWSTPALIIHGGRDYRIPETQGIAAFTALRRRGVEAKLLYFPDENHWVIKPANSILWHDTVLQWIKDHTTA